MSKAFTKEDDNNEADGLDERETARSSIPGGKNYITPAGLSRLREELRNLLHNERPKIVEVVSWAASLGDRSENADYIYGKKRLREIDRRIRFLTKRIESAELIDPTAQKCEEIRFGATITVRDEDGKERIYSIVGIDETDGKRGRISWISPMAKALLGSKAGDVVTVQSPKGSEDLEVLSVLYVEIS